MILSSVPDAVSMVAAHPLLGKSDHCVVQCSFDFHLSTRPVSSRVRRLWAYSEADFADINKCLQAADWSYVSSAPSVDIAWAAWTSTFLDVISK